MSKIFLIAGASTGLGVATAVQAAQAGFTVYASMRNLEKRAALDAAADAAGVALNVIALDVEDTTSVNAGVDQIIADEGRIDVLVANAGVGYARSTEQASEADINWVMDVNFHGTGPLHQGGDPVHAQSAAGPRDCDFIGRRVDRATVQRDLLCVQVRR